MSILGLPQASDLIGGSGLLDTMAGTFREVWQSMGRNGSGEAGTGAVKAYSMFGAWAAGLPQSGPAQQAAAGFALRNCYDRFFANLCQMPMFQLEAQVAGAVPAAWTYLYPASGVYHYLDAHLLRINACHPGCHWR